MPPLVADALRSLVLGMERPPMAMLERAITDLCARHGRRPPARASLYNVLSRIEGHTLLAAIRAVYPGQIDDGLLLRALTYFDDADREAPLRGEGPQDWSVVKDYFLVQVGSLLTPPTRPLAIQAETVDVRRS